MKFVILDHRPSESDRTACTTESSHEARTDERHFDLMFEVEAKDSLHTIAAVELPLVSSQAVDITVLANHRNEYLNYEGPISNNRGTVSRYAFGNWSGDFSEQAVLTFDTASRHFAGESWTIRIDAANGELLRVA
ncbi:hypothetical protein [Mariniblastus fucicola]|nr:hypothetical protein [Mariniblastus fucicola]